MSTKHTKLLDWLKDADDEAVRRTGTTRGYLKQIAYGNKIASPKTAVGIENETLQAVTRRELRPNDWHALWPELASGGEGSLASSDCSPIRQAS